MSKLDIARAVHDPLPDWIEALALECDRTSQIKTAERLGYVPATVSQVLSGKYQAQTTAIEQSVRGVLMREVVTCPALGEIGKDKCQHWRKKARTFCAGNSRDVMMYRACQRCPLHTGDAS